MLPSNVDLTRVEPFFPMQSAEPNSHRLEVRLLGTLALSRDNESIALPASRKVRALFAYLALTREGATRSSLCDLLWEVPNDPRGELRWCLSKIRGVLGSGDANRIRTSNDRISLDVSDWWLDAQEIDATLQSTNGAATIARLEALCALFRGDFLEGLQIDGSARFNSWLLTQRHRFRTMHLSVIEKLCQLLPQGSDEHFKRLQTWLQLAPFDRRAHELLMATLAECGRVPDAEAHLVSAIRQFEAEGVDWLPMREAWRSVRSRYAAQSAPQMIAPETKKAEAISNAAVSDAAKPSRRVSVAVMPFVDSATQDRMRGGIADGLVEDIITRLAKLRVFFVIARGTVFALNDHKIDLHEAAKLLNVEYIVSGSVRRADARLMVKVELVDTRAARIQWAEEFECAAGNAVTDLDRIGNRIVAAIAEEIETSERNRAVLKPPSSLDAWEAYHRGLWHMYRFSGADNLRAEQLFRTAVNLDPTFARAHAGLSFTHFQNAFLHHVDERDAQAELAFQSAGQSLMADDRDPAAHWAMGRALWLRSQNDESLHELSRSLELSPNFALGHYTVGFIHSQSGDPRLALQYVAQSRSLSPFDPLQFAMLAANSLAHTRLGNYEEGANWAVKAAARPNAHIHVLAIAAHSLTIINRVDEARTFAALVRKQNPNYSSADFLTAFRFDKDAAKLFKSAAKKIGFD